MMRTIQIKPLIIAALLPCVLNMFNSEFLRVYGQEAELCMPCESEPPEGWRVIEGDILVRDEALEGVFATNLWPGGIVPYEWHSSVVDNAAWKHEAREAMRVWTAVADIQFVYKESQHADYICIQDSSVNRSPVGMQGGEQPLEIHNWEKFTIAHELGHALGMWHEQSRSDRDTYVTIVWDRIDLDKWHNFFTHDEADKYGPYDFNSIMHYPQCAFTTCSGCNSYCLNCNPTGCRTIIVNPEWADQWQDAIGLGIGLSETDRLTMSFLYPEDNWVFVNESYALAPKCGLSQHGTFLEPYCEFTGGALWVPAGGTVIIQPGSYSGVGVYNKAMKLRAPLGGVTIGL